MATHPRFGHFALLSYLLLASCATHPPTACVGDPETLGYHDGTLGQRLCASSRGSSAIAYESGWNEGVRRFCTAEHGYQQGCQGATMSNVCPDTVAAEYLDGYQSGYAIYMRHLEVDAMERSIEAKSEELERVWSALDSVMINLEQSDADASSRALWLEASRALMTRQTQLNIEIDGLESEVRARKAELSQTRHAIAISY